MPQKQYDDISDAESIGCHKSTVSREIRRNTGQRGYRYQQAQCLTQQRHQHKTKAIMLTDEVKQWIITLLEAFKPRTNLRLPEASERTIAAP